MQILDIEILKYIGVTKHNDILCMRYNQNNKNHLNSIHAAAQFAFAEASSGLFLQEKFPQYNNNVVALLRDAKVKYKTQAISQIIAYPKIDEKDILKFKEQFDKKKRATINISVDVKDENNNITCISHFTWYIQKL